MTEIISCSAKKSSFSLIKFRRVPFPVRHAFENMVRRTLMPVLTGSEFKVLSYIQDRSLGWNVEGFCLFTSEFKDGCKNHNGTGVNHKTTLQAIKRLEELGVVYTHVRGIMRFVWVNLTFNGADLMDSSWDDEFKGRDYWDAYYARYGVTPFSNKNEALSFFLNLNDDQVVELENNMLRKPRRGSRVVAEDEQSTLSEVVERTHNRLQSRRIEQEAAGDVQSAYLNLPPRKTKQQPQQKPDSVIHLESQWVKGIRELYDENYAYLSWGMKEKGQVATFRKKLNMQPEDVNEFFNFVARNWTTIVTKYYSWMSGSSKDTPNIGILVSKPEGFISAFNSRESLDIATKMQRGKVARGNVLPHQTATHTQRGSKVNIHSIYQEMVANPADVDRNSPEFINLPPNYKLRINQAISEMNRGETGFNVAPVNFQHPSDADLAALDVRFDSMI